MWFWVRIIIFCQKLIRSNFKNPFYLSKSEISLFRFLRSVAQFRNDYKNSKYFSVCWIFLFKISVPLFFRFNEKIWNLSRVVEIFLFKFPFHIFPFQWENLKYFSVCYNFSFLVFRSNFQFRYFVQNRTDSTFLDLINF